ncbi:MAG: hypothetical protein K2G32_10960 [Oscillospiraceae bacterium]|nr:hypothetical protein [Oscillospiraceae bacterium]
MKTYTKALVAAVMGTYFFGVVYGAVLVFLSRDHLGEYFAYIGAPTAAAIGFYCWKAKAENMIKMRAELPKGDRDDSPTLEDILKEIEKENML